MNGPKIEEITEAWSGTPNSGTEEVRESIEDALNTEGTSYHGNVASVLWDTLKHIETGLDKVADSNNAIAEALNRIANAIREKNL